MARPYRLVVRDPRAAARPRAAGDADPDGDDGVLTGPEPAEPADDRRSAAAHAARRACRQAICAARQGVGHGHAGRPAGAAVVDGRQPVGRVPCAARTDCVNALAAYAVGAGGALTSSGSVATWIAYSLIELSPWAVTHAFAPSGVTAIPIG
jgi:hypothetical protein